MENHKIRDSQITASSVWRSNHGAANGRLNFRSGNGRTGAWSALKNDVNQWLQVDFSKRTTMVMKISTQGRPEQMYKQWVESYRVYYGMDGTNFRPYERDGMVTVGT